MNRRTFLLGSAATLAGSGLLVGTQGYSRVESQRTVRLQVQDDDDAYLLLQYPTESIVVDTHECAQAAELLILGNQTKEPLDELVVTLGGDLDEVSISNAEFCFGGSESCVAGDIDGNRIRFPGEAALGVGEQVRLRLTIECNTRWTDAPTIQFGIAARGKNTEIIAQRDQQEFQVDVGCECPEEETAWAYGGGKSSGEACTEADNPFATLYENGNGDGSGCRGQWGWYITEQQLRSVSGAPTLYAGAGRNDLDKGTEIGTLWAMLDNGNCGEEGSLFVNYSIDDQVGNKSIEVEETTFTVVENAEELLNNGGQAVAPGDWDRKYRDREGGRCIDVSGMDGFVLAAHASVTITEDSS